MNDKIFCPNCGTQNETGTFFCRNCGNNLQNVVSNVIEQPVVTAEPIVEPTIEQPNEKKKKPIGLIVVAIVLVVVIGIIVFLIFGHGNTKKTSTGNKSLSNTTVFFLKNKNYQYALYDLDGNQLIDFILKRADTFINGASLVENNDGKYGIIGSNGKIIVDFGQYKTIRRNGVMFLASSDDKDYLLNSNGKVVLEADSIKINSSNNVNDITVVYVDKKYYIYDANDNVITSFDLPTYNSVSMVKLNNYILVGCVNKYYLINIDTSKLVVSFESDKNFNISSVSYDGSVVILGEQAYNSGREYIVIKNNQILFKKELENNTSLAFVGNAVSIREGNDYKVLDDNGNIVLNYSRNHNEYDIIDNKNYAEYKVGESGYIVTYDTGRSTTIKQFRVINGEDTSIDGIQIYTNGVKTKVVPCGNLRTASNNKGSNIYLFYNCSINNEYAFYTIDGNLLVDKGFIDARQFDDNKLAIVASKRNEYYLLDENGNQVSDIYDSIRDNYNYYIAKKDGKEYFLDSNGKVIVSGDSVNYYQNANKIKIINDDKYSIYDLNTNKLQSNINGNPDINRYYYELTNGNQKEFYSYTTGKMFYSE